MEKQEKKKRRTDYKRRRTQSKPQSPSFPIDITTEILLRLPKKSLARFSCVSKVWSSKISDPYFINLYEARKPRPSILLCIQNRDNLFVSSIQHTQNSERSYSSSLSIDYHVKLPGGNSYFSGCQESVHGLICFKESRNPIVWNPSTRQFLTLPAIPKANKSWKYPKLFLGYDPVEGKHKVMCIPDNKTSYVCRVFTLGSGQESWRTVRTNHKYRSSCRYTYGGCINGVIYCIAFTFQEKNRILMSFDVRSETFNIIQLPWDIPFPSYMLITYGERLACVARKNGTKLWILEDAKTHKWSRIEFPSPFSLCHQSFTGDLRLNGITRAGEFVYVPCNNSDNQRFYILLCDPVSNSCRRFELKGILGDEYGLDHGVEDVPRYELHAFPNHIESQISL